MSFRALPVLSRDRFLGLSPGDSRDVCHGAIVRKSLLPKLATEQVTFKTNKYRGLSII
jgi:hypothetical protein